MLLRIHILPVEEPGWKTCKTDVRVPENWDLGFGVCGQKCGDDGGNICETNGKRFSGAVNDVDTGMGLGLCLGPSRISVISAQGVFLADPPAFFEQFCIPAGPCRHRSFLRCALARYWGFGNVVVSRFILRKSHSSISFGLE